MTLLDAVVLSVGEEDTALLVCDSMTCSKSVIENLPGVKVGVAFYVINLHTRPRYSNIRCAIPFLL